VFTASGIMHRRSCLLVTMSHIEPLLFVVICIEGGCLEILITLVSYIHIFSIPQHLLIPTILSVKEDRGRVAQWLRCCATNRKVAGSIPASVIAFFIHIKSFRSHYGPGVDSASNRNEYQEYFLGVKAVGA